MSNHNKDKDIFYTDTYSSPNINKIILGEGKFQLINKDGNEISSLTGKNSILIEDQTLAQFPEDSKYSLEIKKVPDEIVDTKKNEKNEKNDKNEKKEKCFPFREGKGLEQFLEKKGIISNSIKSKNINRKKYYIDKERKIKKRRKFLTDNIIKKIKNKIHKSLTKIINDKLEKADSEQKFKNFPQTFISNINKKKNNEALKLTFDQLIENTEIYDGEINENKDVLNYLRENPEISKNSEFEKIKNMLYVDIVKAYFMSEEFEKSIKDLCKSEDKLYIVEYVNKALIYEEYFSNSQ